MLDGHIPGYSVFDLDALSSLSNFISMFSIYVYPLVVAAVLVVLAFAVISFIKGL